MEGDARTKNTDLGLSLSKPRKFHPISNSCIRTDWEGDKYQPSRPGPFHNRFVIESGQVVWLRLVDVEFVRTPTAKD